MLTTRTTLPAIRKVKGAGLTLAWREWHPQSAGLPIVLLHGITSSSRAWHITASLLSDHRVIAFDARGHGESDWDPEEGYTVDMHFADLATALDELEIERCVLAGFSMGGGIAILTAACLPERIVSLAVIDAYPYPEQTPGSERIARWVGEGALTTRQFDPAIARRFREMLAQGNATRADLRSAWEALACPVVIVRGSESIVLPAEVATRMLDDLSHARLETIAGAGHEIPASRPRELAAIISLLAEATAS